MSKQLSCPLPRDAAVWAYLRDSGGDGQDASVEQQERAIRAYCARFDLSLRRVFSDEARPGGTVVGRDAFDDLLRLAAVEPRQADGIIVWSFSRLARNQLDAQFHKSDLRRRGYEIVSLSDDLPDGDYASIIEALIDWKNERFLKDLSRDVMRGLHDLARRGYAPGGFPPVGYKAEPVCIGKRRDGSDHVVSRWVVDPEKADLVQLAWAMRRDGASYRQIDDATHLHKSHSGYSAMFDNVLYLGVVRCGDLRLDAGVEPLVDAETWQAVQQRRREYQERLASSLDHPRRQSSPYLLSGLAVCGQCGAGLTGGTDNVKRGRPWRYYLCSRKQHGNYYACPTRKVNGAKLDAAVLGVVLERVLTPDYADELVAQVNAALAAHRRSDDLTIRDVERRLSEVNRAIQNLLDLAEQTGAAAVLARFEERETERQALEAQLAGLKRLQEMSQVRVDAAVVWDLLAGARDTLRAGDPIAQRALLRQFVERIEVGERTATLTYAFPIFDAVFNVAPPWGYNIKHCITFDWQEEQWMFSMTSKTSSGASRLTSSPAKPSTQSSTARAEAPDSSASPTSG